MSVPGDLDDPFLPPGRQLPHSVEAEKAVLGAILIDNRAFARCSGLLPEHFAIAEHRETYRLISALIDGGKLADPVTIHNQLNGCVPGDKTKFLLSLADSGVTPINAGEYARHLRDLATRREIIEACDEAISGAYSGGEGADASVVAAGLLERMSWLGAGRCEEIASTEWGAPEPWSIPPRQWLLGRMLIRGEVCGIGGSGGRGKTTIALAAALSLVTGRNLIGLRPHSQSRVLYLHMEEPDLEFDRRGAAACLHYGIPSDDIGGRLHRRSGGLKIMAVDGDGQVVAIPDKAAIRALMRRVKPDAVIVDPFKMSYDGIENSNDVINLVVREWKTIASEFNCAVMLVHHFRKGTSAAGDPDGFRGGGAFIDACRSAYTVTPITDEDADRYGLDREERTRIVRLDDAKRNMASASRENWFRLEGIDLGNRTADYPDGDNVQVAARWEPPAVFDGISESLARDILVAIGEGKGAERYAATKRGRNNARWAGSVIADMADCDDAQAKRMLAAWLQSGVVFEDEYWSADERKNKVGLSVDLTKLPGAR